MDNTVNQKPLSMEIQTINKRPMDHIAHLRNKFTGKSINKFEKGYDYIITLIRRGKNPFISILRIEVSLSVKP